MICPRCLLRVARQSRNVIRQKPDLPIPNSRLQRSSYSSSSSTSTKAVSPQHTTTSTPRQGSGSHAPPAATSTSDAQPFSTPLTPSPEAAGISSTPLNKDAGRHTRLIQSSVPAGTPLKGLNFVKGKNDPLAMEDDEYPPWLWDILRDAGSKGEKGDDGVDSSDRFGMVSLYRWTHPSHILTWCCSQIEEAATASGEGTAEKGPLEPRKPGAESPAL